MKKLERYLILNRHQFDDFVREIGELGVGAVGALDVGAKLGQQSGLIGKVSKVMLKP